MLHSPRRSRERILVYGDTGSSKTTSYLNVARWLQRSGSSARIYVADTDNAVPDMLDEGYDDLNNVVVTPVYGFDEYQDWIKQTVSVVNPDDWIVVDMLGDAWTAAQRYFTERVFGADLGNYFLRVREYNEMTEKDKREFDGWTDWKVINKLHQDFTNLLCLRNTCHVLCATKQTPVNARIDDSTMVGTYGRFGVRPEGQKHLGHSFRTVLLVQHPSKNRWTIQSVKDRERRALEGAELSDFTLVYLKGVAGWSFS